jgi:single-stranded DNA-binding protein
MNLNKVMIAGNLTRDPEVRSTPRGTSVADIGLAVNRVYSSEDWSEERRRHLCRCNALGTPGGNRRAIFSEGSRGIY